MVILRKSLISIVVVLFFLWIIPLGAFIKPSQEDIVCAGQRAICLCSHLLAKQAKKVHFQTPGAPHKENVGGGAHDFLVIKHILQDVQAKKISYPAFLQSLTDFDISRRVDHVPKA